MEEKTPILFNSKELVSNIANSIPGGSLIRLEVGNDSIFGVIVKRFVVKQLFLLPHGLYLPVLDSQKLSLLYKLLNNIVKHYHYLEVNIPPENFSLDARSLFDKRFKIIKRECHILRLEESFDEVTEKFNETRQKHVKRALRNKDLKVFTSNELRFFHSYQRLYTESMKRWGVQTATYSEDFINQLINIPNLRLWIAEYKGEVISGMICLYSKEGVFDWLASSLLSEEYKKVYAPVAIQYHVIKHAYDSGLKYVNMGASEHLRGVREFKESWGATAVPYYSIVHKSVFYTLIKFVYKLFGKAYRSISTLR
jgi:hypothetical protein